MKKRWKRFLYGLGVGVLCGLVLEMGVRVWLRFGRTPGDSVYVEDEACGYRLRPGRERGINSFGFRDREHAVQKPVGTWRVLGLGDSFVYGAVRPERNFLRVAEKWLDSDSTRTEMILMGIGGYTTENELGVLRSLGLGLEPDAVVLCFFAGNDVTGLPLRGRVRLGQLYFTGALWRWHDLLRKSWAYLVLERTAILRVKWPILRALGRGRNPEATRDEVTQEPLLPGDDASSGEGSKSLELAALQDETRDPVPPLSPVYLDFQPRRIPVYDRNPGARLRGLWAEVESLLDEFDRTCKTAGVPWILLIVPAEIQVDPQVRGAILRALGEPVSRFDFDLPQQRLHEFATARSIPVLDPLPVLRAAHRPDARLYVPNDSHWNEKGNRIVGEMLGELLSRLRSTDYP